MNIRWPLLARGIKAAGFGIVRFSTIISHAFSYQAICCYPLSGPKSDVDSSRQIREFESFTSPKNPLFSSLFSSPTKPEKQLPRPPQLNKNPPPDSLKSIFVKSGFLQDHPCENLDLEVPSIEISIQKSKIKFKLLELKKLIYTQVPNRPQIK